MRPCLEVEELRAEEWDWREEERRLAGRGRVDGARLELVEDKRACGWLAEGWRRWDGWHGHEIVMALKVCCERLSLGC